MGGNTSKLLPSVTKTTFFRDRKKNKRVEKSSI